MRNQYLGVLAYSGKMASWPPQGPLLGLLVNYHSFFQRILCILPLRKMLVHEPISGLGLRLPQQYGGLRL